MKIHFENTVYSPQEFVQLASTVPSYAALFAFIEGWLSDQKTFHFQSSGSTGKPKKIEIKRRQIETSVFASARALSLSPKDRVLLCLSPAYIASTMMMARALILDMDIYIEKPSANPLHLLDHPIDFASFVPFQIYKMIEDRSFGQLEGIKNILIGGAPLSGEAFDILSSLNTNIYLTYGMTETVSHIALMKVQGKSEDAYYDVIDGVKIGQDEAQCLNISGIITDNQRIQTTDVVQILSPKKFLWLGRADFVINSGGIKIHPEQLEKTIASLLPQTHYFISSVADTQLGSKCVLITETAITDALFGQIQALITDQFSKHHSPKEQHTITPFITTESGKLNRKTTMQQLH
ncbi:MULTISPECIES: AMP-binding protein [Reichenbachiella]|uniref:O-succinylbenzoic acid--CoA ligase n=1 Tax=Reichenbachiella agariperforans TaxID=156994 RepID=A0A1M6WGC6_REIAG|nr:MULTISPECIES: AMP-binding protein [Reichenbachiella]RJE72657.1 hypothetical protein BGP76_01450 [Reichenbachiella sp. MSK19-1]SHK92843.1 O-succinylbenzoic acid--CoA ligase [Reichenbachiella agariperforans]